MKTPLKSLAILIMGLILNSCSKNSESSQSLKTVMNAVPSIKGSPDYIKSPYVTAGDRLYMIGFQDGTFPKMGFHTPGEMSGIWDHPIKLMDGFSVELKQSGVENTVRLEQADTFINYPFANEHIYHLTSQNIDVTRFQFVPDSLEGVVVEFSIKNNNSTKQDLEFIFNGAVDLSPVWLSERINIKDGKDFLSNDETNNAIVGKDALNDWYVAFGSTQPLADVKTQVVTKKEGNGVMGSFQMTLAIEAGETKVIPVYIAGSWHSQNELIKTFNLLKASSESLLSSKKARYKKIEQMARITIPDKKIQEMYTWTKYTTDWLMRNVPGTGNGLGAGLPDYPWWFACDNEYSAQGILCIGQPGLVKKTLLTLDQLSEKNNGNGRIVHEVSTNGVVYNPGNLNETPQFANAVWEYYRWTGDKEILVKLYPTIRKGLSWLLDEHDKDKNLSPEGSGMMEISGLDSEMIDVAVYTQLGLTAAANIAGELGKTAQQKEYSEKALLLKSRINSDWWVEESSSFGDFRSTSGKALEIVDGAIIRADTIHKPWAVKELKDSRKKIGKYLKNEIRAHVVHHNWVVNTPMEAGLADPEKAVKALETAKKYNNRFGMYVTGIDRVENDGTSEKWKSFSYVGAVMTLSTGVQAIAECNYGRYDKALGYLRMLSNSFSYALPGSLYEVSPDYGMFVQEWNVYAIAKPVVYYFFGIQPEAYAKQIRIAPRMPEEWNDASLENLPVGDNTISLTKATNNNEVTYTINQSKDDWKILFSVLNTGAKEIFLNDTIVQTDLTSKEIQLSFSGKNNSIRIKF